MKSFCCVEKRSQKSNLKNDDWFIGMHEPTWHKPIKEGMKMDER